MFIPILAILIIISTIFEQSSSYFITVDADAEECFFERVEIGTKMALTFEIAEGDFLDIDVSIIGPKGRVIFDAVHETSAIYRFSAYASGVYTYCFSNKSIMTPKVVMFNMAIEKSPKNDDQANAENTNKLEDMIRELSASLTSFKQELEYMQVRDRIHHSINESTNSRVVMWSSFEALILVSMIMGQVYLKHFCEVRCVIK